MRLYRQFKLVIVGVLIWISQSFYVNESNFSNTSFGQTQDLGVVSNLELNEASGMVASWRNPGLYWVINDSEDLNRIFFSGSGRTRES